MADVLFQPADLNLGERLDALGPDGRLAAYEDGGLSIGQLQVWAARYPEEVPLINGELPWIAATLADLE